jgi:hypothetical protein
VDDKDLRQTVSATVSGSSTTVATTNKCTLGEQTGPIIVRQVIGEKEKQKVLDIHVVVPDRKPSIEQIIDVFVKDVEVLSVDVIPDKVIVRGELEVKAIYVACVPEQSVHAVEIKHYKWTQDIDLPGARKGMDADASVVVEFVDFDVAEDTCAYRHKYGMKHGHNQCFDDDDDCDDDCMPEPPLPPEPPIDTGVREFDVSIVLKITAKVLADREVQLGMTMPVTPKG